MPDSCDEIDVPIVPFVLTSYRSSYYVGRPWYHRRAHWGGYWQSHELCRDDGCAESTARVARIGRAAAARDAALPEAEARARCDACRWSRRGQRAFRVEERTRAGATETVAMLTRFFAGVDDLVTRDAGR